MNLEQAEKKALKKGILNDARINSQKAFEFIYHPLLKNALIDYTVEVQFVNTSTLMN